MAVLRLGSKCSHTTVYAPLFHRATPFEHLKILRSNAKSRLLAGAMNPDPHFCDEF
jgi:hypothetical protein